MQVSRSRAACDDADVLLAVRHLLLPTHAGRGRRPLYTRFLCAGEQQTVVVQLTRSCAMIAQLLTAVLFPVWSTFKIRTKSSKPKRGQPQSTALHMKYSALCKLPACCVHCACPNACYLLPDNEFRAGA